MPRRTDLETILILGSGPIVIGQACEFDYSATQGCKALREEGYRLILLNSNPATVMTDPELSDRTYIEPMTLEVAREIIALEKPQAILPTLGGQTALNLAMDLHKAGVLDQHGVEMIGSNPMVIEVGESRERFREAMAQWGLAIPASGLANSVEEALVAAERGGFPAIVRPSFTLGGSGGGIAYNREELKELAWRGLTVSPISQILVERSLIGWKELELEMIRDLADNAIIVCGIENVDPMGVHTGDSVTVAPIQTLTDVEYQALRDDALKVARAVGLNGGCNIQFAISPENGQRVVIEMNPRVSRSSALASKATGFPIARVAAKLAVGYTLGELKNGITGKSACFEPALDYCVVKAPRFNFEKFAGASPVLGLEMRAVGETMALGGNFREALQKALRGLETGRLSLECREAQSVKLEERLDWLKRKLVTPDPDRLAMIYSAFKLGLTLAEANALTGLDPWFLGQLMEIWETEKFIAGPLATTLALGEVPPVDWWIRVKSQGFSDLSVARIVREARPGPEITPAKIRALRLAAGARPRFRQVDTCAGEFAAETPYYYSSYDAPTPPPPLSPREPGQEPGHRPRKVMILGGGPNRIGQGIEFDYCCVKACQAFEEMGYATVMVNSNPETVSTDYDAVGRLYFEPVTLEDVLAVIEVESPDGIIVQLGGQTPLNLAQELKNAGAPIWGTAPEAIFQAEDRQGWNDLVSRLQLKQPPSGMAPDIDSACRIAESVGYPVIVRPSFVLGGRAMKIIHRPEELGDYLSGLEASGLALGRDTPILVDKFLDDAVEVDVDAVADGEKVVIAAIMEHIERAGVHSGDSCCSIPPFTLSPVIQAEIRQETEKLGLALGVKGLMNIQFAVRQGQVYVLEANPRASRTAPFVAKATGRPLIQTAAKVMAGQSLRELGFVEPTGQSYYAVKEAVLPWNRFAGAEVDLGPEMRSTGEVMGLDDNFGLAFLKAQAAAGMTIPRSGDIVMTVSDRDKVDLVPLARELTLLGFTIHATPGTKEALEKAGVAARRIDKVNAPRPNLIDFLLDGKAGLLVNTTSSPTSIQEASLIRWAAIRRGVTMITTMASLKAAVAGLKEIRLKEGKSQLWRLSPLQSYHGQSLGD
ncbi:MAG: carbamoyl-phosphate synthase large subunit [Deltaproteobacteria bacterium]|jgi:carbamoyl-phosphate synthase large subunit|nr:carbamoyl-phosphate synthase large subunit [Deltaproteobacteria bacterium]